MLYIYACSDQICSVKTRNVENLTVVPFFSYNPNVAPVYSGIVGYKLPVKELYINHNYNSTPYTLPNTYDYDGDSVYTDIYLRNERLFTFFDNDTKSFKFYNRKILARWEGNYTTTVTLGDNNWLGPRETKYSLTFRVMWQPNATIIPVPANKTSQGANITDMGLTGKISMNFNAPMFINPKYYRKP